MITNKSLIIAKREFLSVIKQKMFLIVTFGIPLFFFMVGILSFFHTFFLSNELTFNLNSIGIIDKSGLINFNDTKNLISSKIIRNESDITTTSFIKPVIDKYISRVKIIPYSNLDSGLKDLKYNKLGILYVIPRNYIKTGKVLSYSKRAKIFNGGDIFLRWTLRCFLLKPKVSDEILQRVQQPLFLTHYMYNDLGQLTEENDLKLLGAILIPYLASGIMMLAIFIPASYLLHSISEEKDGKIIEVLLSSVSCDDLLMGKLIGLSAAGLIQAFIWLIFIAIPLSLTTIVLKITFLHIFMYILYIILGFLLYASIMVCVAAVSSDTKQSAQIAGIASAVSVIPLLFMPIIVLKPDGLFSKFLSYFPLTSSVTMIVRISTSKIDLNDVIITLLILIPTILITLKFASKVFRTGILLYGKKLNLKEILKSFKSTF